MGNKEDASLLPASSLYSESLRENSFDVYFGSTTSLCMNFLDAAGNEINDKTAQYQGSLLFLRQRRVTSHMAKGSCGATRGVGRCPGQYIGAGAWTVTQEQPFSPSLMPSFLLVVSLPL